MCYHYILQITGEAKGGWETTAKTHRSTTTLPLLTSRQILESPRVE